MKIFTKQINRTRPGVSLVEVILVLGIASLMIGGSFAWFDAQKGSDFYNEVRQVESRIREVQSQNTSSQVPGYDLGSASVCNNEDREIGLDKCVIGKGEEVFGTAVAISVPNTGDTFTKLKIFYLKKDKESDLAPLQSLLVTSYANKEVELPATLKLEGFTVFGDGQCTTGAYSPWRNLPETLSGSSAGYQDFRSATNESLVVFRRTTGGYNTFWPNANVSTFDTTGVFNGAKPWWSGTASSPTPAWLGSYDDASYQYGSVSPSAATRLRSQPCAVLWRFGSVERKAGSPGEPRFKAEINFNLVDGTTTLVTR